MKTTDKTETLASIDTLALDNVTGGCAACGQNCGAGAAPSAGGGRGAQQSPWAQQLAQQGQR